MLTFFTPKKGKKHSEAKKATISQKIKYSIEDVLLIPMSYKNIIKMLISCLNITHMRIF